MSGLDDQQRKTLARIISTSRTTLFEDAARTLRGSYGILADGSLQAIEDLAPDPATRERRLTLEGVLEHLQTDGLAADAAVERLTREVAFTHLNRLLAIRVADALGVLAPSLRDGADSAGFRQWVSDIAPLLATADDTRGYWTYLCQCADELAVDAPALFDPRNPLLALRPSAAALEVVVTLLADPDVADIWDADDTFGWAYQFFNSKDERQEMRRSSAPRDSRELAVRNQFFTPDYVVRFLVHNTLGRRLLDADPDSPLLDQLPLLIDPPTEPGTPLDLAHARVLDPACGSGHFLLGCYDVLEAAWQIAGVTPADAAPHIIPCLWGVDIDPRAVQVAQAALIFRARRACGQAPLSPPNIVCARALPEDPAAWESAQQGLGDDLKRLISTMRDALRDAPLLGPLLKVEEQLASEIRTTVVAANDTIEDLFSSAGIADDAFGTAERAVISALQRAADATAATPAERLLAAHAIDAVRFIETVRNRYDAVLMNPPFGEPVPSTKEYIKAAYPWIPTRDYNLLAAFVGRGVELCNTDGYLGAITSRAGLFLKTSMAWRKEVLLSNRLVALADLGYGVMEEALVEAAAYVVAPRSNSARPGAYIRLLKDSDRPEGLRSAIANDRGSSPDDRVYRASSNAFDAVPGSPLAYWMSDSIRKLFTDLPQLEGPGGECRVGVQTGDDFRFLRLAWEVRADDVVLSREQTLLGGRWVSFAKGGEYSPFWADLHLMLNWENDGEQIRSFPGARPQNTQYFFSAGLTWPRRTNSGFGIRVLPNGAGFGDKGPALLQTGITASTLAYLRSRLVQAMLDASVAAGEETTSGGASRSYEVGMVQNLPWPFADGALDELDELGNQLIELAAEPDLHDETARLFRGLSGVDATTVLELTESSMRRREDRTLEMIDLSWSAEETIFEHLDIDDAGRRYLDEEQAAHPATYEASPIDDEARALRYLGEPIDRVIDDVVEISGGSRAIANLTFIGDRRLEVLSHAFRRHPRSIVELRRRHGMLPPNELSRTASRIISWLVGVAFGRWDARTIPDGPPFDPFAPVALCPPALLVGADGLPSTEPPAEYPLALPVDEVMLAEPGHSLDLASAVEVAASTTGLDGGLLADAVDVLGRRSLTEYLDKAFFKENLGRYTKSRRQAPIYWHLRLPSGGWGAWLYAPRFSREMLFAVTAHADRRLAASADRLRALQDDESIAARQRSKAIDEERTLAAELRDLRNDVAHLAGLGWQPDLDDGFVLNAAPLARWFPKNTWRQLDEHLVALREGRYPWATIHQYRDEL